ncbi:hypothetical protein [Thalassobacillus sp. CUG 92003]|uniref:hypothetical protein n=1 Tax=Thalassobacillus sp. CUG 92003 TaxID=2736641 RepID=UPI0015E668BB|nr:hypothetical protein [Thalassobacillus sp. CUG 92003]
MRPFAWMLLLIHSVILVLWIMNAESLFSTTGIVFWLITVAAGFMIQTKLNTELLVKKLVVSSSYFMVFLCVMTLCIYVTTRSMP